MSLENPFVIDWLAMLVALVVAIACFTVFWFLQKEPK